MADKKTTNLFLEIEEEVGLIALYSSLEVFRIAYQINRVLNISLRREERDIDFRSNGNLTFYPWYHYKDNKALLDFYLVGNKASAKPAKLVSHGGLLFEEDNVYYTYLIPERKRVDYFFKIEGTTNADPFIEKLKQIKRISAVFPVSTKGLKSYTNLIFD